MSDTDCNNFFRGNTGTVVGGPNNGRPKYGAQPQYRAWKYKGFSSNNAYLDYNLTPENWDLASCIPGYVRDLMVGRCRNRPCTKWVSGRCRAWGNVDRFGGHWLVRAGSDINPKYGIIQTRPSDVSSGISVPLDMYGTLFLCRCPDCSTGGGAGANPAAYWPSGFNVAIPAGGMTSGCNQSKYELYNPNNLSHEFLKFGNSYDGISMYNVPIVERGRTPNYGRHLGQRGGFTAFRGFRPNYIENSNNTTPGILKNTFRLDLRRFREMCVDAEPADPGTCSRSGQSVVVDGASHEIWNVKFSAAFWRGGSTSCQNLTDQMMKLVMRVPKANLQIAPSASSLVNPTEIYVGQTATFTHQTGAQISDNYQGSNHRLNFYVVDTDENGQRLPSADWKARLIRSETITGETQQIANLNFDVNFQAKTADLNQKICRRVWWETYDLTQNPTGAYDGPTYKWAYAGNTACVTVKQPPVVITPSGSTTVDKENIVPGTKATFKHKTSAKVETNYDGSDAELYFYVIDATTTGDLLPGAQWRARTIRSETISSQTQNLPEASATTDFQAKDSDLGKTVCRRIWWEIFDKNLNPEKKVYDGPGYKWGWGGNVACTTIPYNYTLVPNITLDGQAGDQSTPPGSEHEVTGKITNNGPTLSKAYQWQITRFNYSPGIKPPTEISHNNRPPAANFCSQSTAKDCEAIKSGTSQSGLPNKAIAELVQTGSLKLQVPLNAQPGSRYCVALSVQPYQALSDNWAHSRPVCVVVAKTPSTQIHGTNLLVPQGRVIAKSAIFNHIGNAPTPICPHNIKGCAFTSWGEYDILARGEIAGLSSNSGSLINNHETDPSSSNFWHQLSFANDPLPGNFVASSSSGLVVNRAQKISNFFLSQAKSTPNLVASQLTINDLNLEANKLNFVRHQGSNLSLKGSLAAGQSLIVIQESGDLIIDGNLEYPAQDNITHPSQYAQLVLIVKDGNLVINDNVTRVDAWLIATGQNSKQGRLKTCNYQAVSSTVCHHPLRINGPVMTDYLDLLRTYGAEYPVSINQPAEVFNFRPDAYLWLINQTQSRNIFRTTLIKNAAPRY